MPVIPLDGIPHRHIPIVRTTTRARSSETGPSRLRRAMIELVKRVPPAWQGREPAKVTPGPVGIRI